MVRRAYNKSQRDNVARQVRHLEQSEDYSFTGPGGVDRHFDDCAPRDAIRQFLRNGGAI